MATVLEIVQVVDWAKGNEAELLLIWENLGSGLIGALEQWCSAQNDVTNALVDVHLQAIDFVITTLAETKPVCSPKLLCRVVETLPTFDLLVIEKKSLHFKLMGLVWKGVCKIAQNHGSTELSALNSGSILSCCISRALNNIGRSKEEEKKIRAFFLSQLVKLLTENLPNRADGMPGVCDGLVRLHEFEPGSIDNAIIALAKDPEAFKYAVMAFEPNVELLEVFLSNLPPEKLSILLPPMTKANHVAFRVYTKHLEVLSPEHVVESLLNCDDASEFAFRGLAILNVLRQNADTARSHAPIWTRASIQLWLLDNARNWTGQAARNERLIPMTLFTWNVDPVQVIKAILGFGQFSQPLTLLDWARISFLRYAPESEWLIPLKPSLLQIGDVTASEISQLGRSQCFEIIHAKMELVCVLGRCGVQSSELLSASLAAFEYAPNIALEAIAFNAHSFANPGQLLHVFGVCRPYYSKIGGWTQLLKSLRHAPCLQKRISTSDEHLEKEIIALMLACMEDNDRLATEEAFSSMADLLSMADFPKLRDLVPGPLKHDFLEFLRHERQSSVALKHLGCSFASADFSLPHLPPNISKTGDENVDNVSGRERVHDCVNQLERLCERIPLSQLNDLENRILLVIQQERARRST